jgi:hypothetical protein
MWEALPPITGEIASDHSGHPSSSDHSAWAQSVEPREARKDAHSLVTLRGSGS